MRAIIMACGARRGAWSPPSLRRPVMKVVIRAVAVSVMLSLAWAGPLAPLAVAQQPAAPAPAQPSAPPPAQPSLPPPAQPSAPPQMFQEDVKLAPRQGGIDAYDVGAVAATAL